MVVGKTCEQWIKEGKGATTRDNPPRLGPGSGLIAEIGMEPAQTVWRASDWAREQIADPAIKWTRLSCRTFAANAVRLQLHAQLGGQTTRDDRWSLANSPGFGSKETILRRYPMALRCRANCPKFAPSDDIIHTMEAEHTERYQPR